MPIRGPHPLGPILDPVAARVSTDSMNNHAAESVDYADVHTFNTTTVNRVTERCVF